jgi:hypothetical protein
LILTKFLGIYAFCLETVNGRETQDRSIIWDCRIEKTGGGFITGCLGENSLSGKDTDNIVVTIHASVAQRGPMSKRGGA